LTTGANLHKEKEPQQFMEPPDPKEKLMVGSNLVTNV
jgi:hypothetical protein